MVRFYEVALASGDGKQIFPSAHKSAATMPLSVVGAFVGISGRNEASAQLVFRRQSESVASRSTRFASRRPTPRCAGAGTFLGEEEGASVSAVFSEPRCRFAGSDLPATAAAASPIHNSNCNSTNAKQRQPNSVSPISDLSRWLPWPRLSLLLVLRLRLGLSLHKPQQETAGLLLEPPPCPIAKLALRISNLRTRLPVGFPNAVERLSTQNSLWMDAHSALPTCIATAMRPGRFST
jgi:hypothetical protein